MENPESEKLRRALRAGILQLRSLSAQSLGGGHATAATYYRAQADLIERRLDEMVRFVFRREIPHWDDAIRGRLKTLVVELGDEIMHDADGKLVVPRVGAALALMIGLKVGLEMPEVAAVLCRALDRPELSSMAASAGKATIAAYEGKERDGAIL